MQEGALERKTKDAAKTARVVGYRGATPCGLSTKEPLQRVGAEAVHSLGWVSRTLIIIIFSRTCGIAKIEGLWTLWVKKKKEKMP